MRQKVSGIYLITCKPENGLHMYYVGQSKDCYSRWSCHKRDLKNGRHSNWKLRLAYSEYGITAFSFMVLEERHESELNEAEQFWLTEMAGHSSCFNLAVDATSGMRGRKHSEETKARLSATHLNGSAPWKGKKLSAEHRKKLSESHKGNRVSEQAKEKLRAANAGKNHPNYGKQRPPEVVEKMRLANRKRPVMGVCLETLDVVFLACLEEANKNGFNKWHVANCANGVERKHKGYSWRWINVSVSEEENTASAAPRPREGDDSYTEAQESCCQG